VLVEQVEVRPRRAALAEFGYTVAELGRTVELMLEGKTVTLLHVGQRTYPVVLRLDGAARADLATLRALPVGATADRRLRLGDVADVGVTLTSNELKRENATRRIAVHHNVQGRSISQVVTEVEAALAPIRRGLPAGYAVRVVGQFEAQQRAQRVILLLSVLSLLAVGVVLFWHFGSLNLVLQTLANVPPALLGGAIAILLSGQDVSVASLVGFISLSGIATRNKILLLDHYLHLMREEGEEFSEAMIRRAGQERIVPVLMTALTSGIALIPLVWSPNQPGRELLYPVATVILGGLVMTTLMDLLLTPGLFWRCGRRVSEQVLAGSAELPSHGPVFPVQEVPR
ncbi:MAG: efflux RND transporter permease subunit, partial [Planctomycetes bacterium]|nr:efflux RND transporter permease subunit [Planctomycetota bacterium]